MGLLGRGLAGMLTGGLSEIVGEDTMSKVPVLNTLTGAQSDAYKNLIKKQGQMAEEAKLQQERNQQMRMNALGQSILAFNPQNQMMAQMFGPQAAFSPQQFAQMGANPNGPPQLDPGLINYRGNNPKYRAQIEDYLKKKKEYEAHQQQLAGQMTPVGPGPAPLQNRMAPAAARKF